MKERPILFTGPMVRAILAGTKTQTRRAIQPVGKDDGFTIIERAGGEFWPYRSTDGESGFYERTGSDGKIYLDEAAIACPCGRAGERLWVRETWVTAGSRTNGQIEDVEYRADEDDSGVTWFPSIHMPRWASRITLEVVGVRVEQLHAMSEEDAIAEGLSAEDACPDGDHIGVVSARDQYAGLWDSLNGLGSWDANPWVWVIEFRRV